MKDKKRPGFEINTPYGKPCTSKFYNIDTKTNFSNLQRRYLKQLMTYKELTGFKCIHEKSLTDEIGQINFGRSQEMRQATNVQLGFLAIGRIFTCSKFEIFLLVFKN